MLLRVFNLISFGAFGLCMAKEQMLPVTTCHRDATDYSTCLRDAIQEAWPRFIQGLPEFNFPPIDPAFYDHHYVTIRNGVLYVNAHAVNTTFIGFANARFLDAKAYFTDNIFHLEIDFQTPQISLEGLLNLIGSVGPFRVNSTGHYKLVITDLKIRWDITGPVADDRWIPEHFIIIPRLKKMKGYFTGFLGSEEFDKLFQDFANEYWPALFRAIGPIVMKNLDPMFVEMITPLFSNVSFSKIFPK
ncbi:hypothetical protein DMN91_000203 [Ooceraea biroi]|uniref:Circadian clock-controlled protein n=1 Tax=Ooceraea biroi TaxID=2015173 RepID=A0A3L8E2I1_OOCBI|nr:uncharacterized protein LOC105279376 [Ooceraea biroi]RLU26409.1 hypothetical protein DMN91_000203 [Ooceraea biroi]